MADFPILFTFRHVVKGPSFEAVVTASGRTLIAEEEPGEWWCHGVEPGGLTAEGPGPSSSFEKFCASFRHALDDLAELASSIEAFHEEACALFETDQVESQRWDNARARILHDQNIPDQLNKLPRKIWNESELEVLPLDQFETAPQDAVREQHGLPLAA